MSLAIQLVRLLHANGWKYSFERGEGRDYDGAPDSEWVQHTWTRDGQEVQTFTGDCYDGITWRPDEWDSFVSTDRAMLAKLGYEGAVRLLLAIGAVGPAPIVSGAADHASTDSGGGEGR